MLSGILLFLGRRKQTVLRVIIDHRLGQNLVVLVPLGALKLTVHEGSHLIHVKIDAGDVFGMDIVDPIQTFQNALQEILTVYCHRYHLGTYYIVFKTI